MEKKYKEMSNRLTPKKKTKPQTKNLPVKAAFR